MGGGRCVCDDTVDELRELTEREWAAEMRGWAGKELGGESRLAGWPPPRACSLTPAHPARYTCPLARSAITKPGRVACTFANLRVVGTSRNEPREQPLPDAVASGTEPLYVPGALSGG
jgi:hypothetical protein